MTTSQAVKSKNVEDSHFVSLPLSLHPEMVTKLNNFQNSVLQTNKDLGIEKSIFINPKTLHLTVQMLKLWNTDRIEAAAEVLRACMKHRGTPAKAYVVHAPLEIDGEDRLLRACHVIIDAFTEAGLVLEKDANRKLELHATIMNARHKKSKKKSEKTDPFDARPIFAQYGSENWGECHIREAHLSQRYVYDSNGYFHCCASIPFPEEKRGVFPMTKNFFQKMFS